MKRVVLTGGTGFVGACLTRRLLADGHDVHLLVRESHDPWRITDRLDDLERHRVDLGDADGVAAKVAAIGPDWVFHLAAHGAYPHQTSLRRMVDTNVLGTESLLEAAARCDVDAFVAAGSSSEYGFRNDASRESDRLEPNSPYAITKAAATMLCRHAARTSPMRIRVLRLYSVYGPLEEPTRLVPRLLVSALDGHWPPLANPDTARDFVYVDDVVDAFVTAAVAAGGEPGAIFNVCSGVQTTLRGMVETCREIFDVRAEPQWASMAPRSWDTSSWVGDPSGAATVLPWRARTTVRDGLRAFAGWLRDRPDRLERYRRADPRDAS
ncbi:MAG: NAD-dependent epimerase/dehydratase family protein [Vicinamibacterales bacterium]